MSTEPPAFHRNPSSQGNGASRDAGSVLVEAMVAVAVIAMMLAVTYRAVGDSVLRSRAAEASRTATMIAQSRMASVGSEIAVSPGQTTGVDGDFTWRVDVESAPADASTMGNLMAVTVAARDRAGHGAVLRTLRLAPAA